MQDREKARSDLLAEIAQLRQRLAVYEHDAIPGKEDGQASCRNSAEAKGAEKSASEKEELLRATVDAMTESVLLLDRSGVFRAVNRTAAERLGCRVEDIVGVNGREIGSEIMPPSVRQARAAHFDEVVRTGSSLRLTDERAGRFFDQTYYPVFDDGGCVSHVVVFAVDITARVNAQRELEEVQSRYRDLVEGIVDVTVSLDRSGRILWGNRVLKDMLGYDSDEVVGRHLSDFILGDRRDAMEVQSQRVLNGESVRSETVLVARDGALVHVEYSAAPVAREGHIVAIQCVVRDVTQRKRLECKLKESEERYRTLVENAGEAIAVVNRDGVFQFMNTTAARRLGGKPEAFIGRTMSDLFPGGIADRQLAMIRQVIETGRGCNSVSLSHVLGERRWYNTTIEPLRDSAGIVVSGLVIARDIHDLKQAQDELDAYRERMIRTEQLASVGTLSATLAHELTQPLTVIRLSIQNSLNDLAKVACPTRIMEDLRDGLTEVSSVTAIAERFRNFARRSAEKIATRVATSTVARRVMDLLAESARRSKVTLTAEGLDGLPLLCIPEKDLEQLVFALAQNAIQAADGQRNARFQITGIQNATEVELQFTDNCGGIATENLPRVFEPFFTTKPASEGTGLGLCIVQRVVSDAHGQVRVRTDFGRGTTFTVTLPIPED